MKSLSVKYMRLSCIVIILCVYCRPSASAHDIYFCGEAIPTSRDFVATKLMGVIRNQIPVTTLASLRYQAQRHFPAIAAWLKYYGIPEDFKYVPIVECGFRNVSSDVGARGLWQLMPDVARELHLVMLPDYDERDIPFKATTAACQLIRQHHELLKKNLNTSSWILTAAAYNFGPGNIIKTVKSQGTDYFNLKLNDETAEYVYRLIAVKELFEHPELYMNGFDANIFNGSGQGDDADVNKLARGPATSGADKDFSAINVKLGKKGKAPVVAMHNFFVPAQIVANGKPFRDGNLITFELLGDLRLDSSFRRKGSRIKGKGWVIDGRVFVDLGFGTEVEVQDKMLQKGLTAEDAATDEQYVLLKTQVSDENQ